MLLNEKKNHYLRAGLVLTGLMAALALLGCVWTPYPPTAMSGSEKFAAPCLRHLFGTDNFGRDIFSRVLAGAMGEVDRTPDEFAAQAEQVARFALDRIRALPMPD